MAPREGPPPAALVVRPVVEEFKAHAQERIAELERAKKVDALRVFLDAAELGVQVLIEAQMEAAGEGPPEAEPPAAAAPPAAAEAEEEPGVETEDLDSSEESEPPSQPGKWSLRRDDEVLV
ncbi:MAG: hypothetical protein MUC63_09725, partial [Planctomycetes bacterium]|nr:hypothetical protein [Planctomycetota bacterium]